MENSKKCDKLQVSILLSTYEPNLHWLSEQLNSLNTQTYPNLKLYVRDDFSTSVTLAQIADCLKDCITDFPYELNQNEKNLGSNKTFELLTKEADGSFFAYCDQDDIWLPDKIDLIVSYFQNPKVSLVCSDLQIINENGGVVADSITKIRKRHIFHSGNDVTKHLIVSNFVVGCSMVIRSNIARKAIPFEKLLVHDQWLAIVASTKGEILSLNQALVQYRQHSKNQTGILLGVNDKSSYLQLRVELYKEINQSLKKYEFLSSYNLLFEDRTRWLEYRKNYLQKPNISDLISIWRLRKLGFNQVLFETFMPFIPKCIFNKILDLLKRGVL